VLQALNDCNMINVFCKAILDVKEACDFFVRAFGPTPDNDNILSKNPEVCLSK